MTNGGRLLMGTLGILVFWTGMRVIATETSGGTPYQGIVERNVFGLKPPPPPPDPEAHHPPPPKIVLQGITTFGHIKRALFKMQLPPKPGEPAKGEQSFILAEGQRDGDIEVLEINATAGSEFVKVNNFGTITNLTFENNGIKTASAAAPGPQPGPRGFVPPPANPFGAGGAPTRPMRMNPAAAAAASGGYGGTASPTSYGGMRGQSTYTAAPAAPAYNPNPGVVMSGGTAGTLALPGLASAPTTTTSQPNWPPETPMTPEEAAIQAAAYMTKNKTAIENGLMPSIPGSNPLLDSGNSSGQTAAPKSTTPTLPLPPGAARPFPY
jgi:hypothetical protein